MALQALTLVAEREGGGFLWRRRQYDIAAISPCRGRSSHVGGAIAARGRAGIGSFRCAAAPAPPRLRTRVLLRPCPQSPSPRIPVPTPSSCPCPLVYISHPPAPASPFPSPAANPRAPTLLRSCLRVPHRPCLHDRVSLPTSARPEDRSIAREVRGRHLVTRAPGN